MEWRYGHLFKCCTYSLFNQVWIADDLQFHLICYKWFGCCARRERLRGRERLPQTILLSLRCYNTWFKTSFFFFFSPRWLRVIVYMYIFSCVKRCAFAQIIYGSSLIDITENTLYFSENCCRPKRVTVFPTRFSFLMYCKVLKVIHKTGWNRESKSIEKKREESRRKDKKESEREREKENVV